jgi:hypothetical protein
MQCAIKKSACKTGGEMEGGGFKGIQSWATIQRESRLKAGRKALV